MMEHGGSCWLLTTALILALAPPAWAQSDTSASPTTDVSTGIDSPIDNSLGIPDLSQVLPSVQTREGMSATLQIVVIMTVLMLAPSILIMTTCFTRILIVLG